MSLSLPSASKRDRIVKALANPAFFGEVYIRPFDTNWVEPLPRFGLEMLSFAQRHRRGVVILPPEFLKTTLLSQVFPLWLTFSYTMRGELLRGMLLSEEEGMAVNNLSVISWHIQHNDLLAADFADNNGRPLVYPDPEEKTWREDSIVVCRRGTSKDPTWQAKGLDSRGIQGRRLDWLIGDDVITPANAFSPAKREKALRDWDMQITTRLVKEGHAVIAGNFNDPHDLVSTLAARASYAVFKRPASHRPGKPDMPMDPDEETAVLLWPSNWSRPRLRQEKQEKPLRFQRIFMLSAASEYGEKLRTDWVRLITPDDTPLRYCRFFLGLDAAPGGEGEDLDFFNITVGALHNGGLDIVESLDVRCPTPRQVSLVGAMHDRWDRLGGGVIAIGVAKTSLDRYFRGAVTVARKDLDHKLVDISIPGSKEERLEALGPYAKTGWMRIWEQVWLDMTSDIEDQYQELSMFEQWRDFPLARHDDKLDALDITIRCAREFELLGSVEFDLEVLSGD